MFSYLHADSQSLIKGLTAHKTSHAGSHLIPDKPGWEACLCDLQFTDGI